MPALRDNAITRLSTTIGVSLNNAAKQTLFIVPTGKSAIVTHVILRNASASATTADAGFGGDTPATDFRTGVQFNGLAGVGDGVIVTSENPDDPSSQPGTIKTYAAGVLFGIDMGSLVAATVDVDVFGYLI